MPEEKPLGSTLTCFEGNYVKKRMTLLLSAASLIVMPWCSKLLSASFIMQHAETLGGMPVILWVRHHGIMKSLAHQVEI